MEQERTMTGKTVEEAIEVALRELDVGRGEAEVEIISRGKPGFLGIGSELAKVRVRKIAGSQSAATFAMETVKNILGAAGAQTLATLRSAHDQESGGPVIDISGEDSGLLIGRRGETLRALQFMVNMIVNTKLEDADVRVALDVERYRERRSNNLRDLAKTVADKVANSGRAITLEPMSPADRRVIHVTLAEHPRVTTQSAGFGEQRKVTIAPKRE